MKRISFKRGFSTLLILAIILVSLPGGSSLVMGMDTGSLKVVLAGNIQGALGGDNWNPAGEVTRMKHIGNGIYALYVILNKGKYEYKIAVGGTWDENYGTMGAPNGGNISVEIPFDHYPVRFLFDYNTKQIQDSVTGGIEPYGTVTCLKVLGLGIGKTEMTKFKNGEYKLTVKLPKGKYSYQVQYNNSEALIYGAKGILQGKGIQLVLDKETKITFVHDIYNNVSYDSKNYISVAPGNIPVLSCKGLQKVIMQDEDKDNIFTGKVTLPKGTKNYSFKVSAGKTIIAENNISFNEIVDDYEIDFEYNIKTNKLSNNYVERLDKPDGKIIERSIFYNSREAKFKKPYGAVVKGTKIRFVLSTKANDLETVNLIIEKQKITGNFEKVEYLEKKVYPMKKTLSIDGSRDEWATGVQLDETNVYAYYFELNDGSCQLIYGNNSIKVKQDVIGVNGVGRLYRPGEEVIRYRQTVYDPSFTVPDWAKDSICYQVFPERFKNGNKLNDPKANEKTYGNIGTEIHENWLETPWKPGNEDGNTLDDEYYNNDYFGGDLEGIIQKLPYLKDLGVNMLYLNPIFEAPSNHKYDTADYMKVDPHFGTNSDLKNLVDKAKAYGIKIIMDASLNHCSTDSIYMDRYSKYPGGDGAFEGEKPNKSSPWFDWFEFNPNASTPDKMYNCWLGYDQMANLNESKNFKDFAFLSKTSVSKYWSDMGISGWRMDVTPYVTDDFWREWKNEMKANYPDMLTIAEVWTDASKYLLGDMFDTNMNYVFQEILSQYADGGSAKDAVNMLEMLKEDYPPEAFYSLMNLVGSHDIQRALYRFGYKEQGESKETVQTAKSKYLLSVFFQMVYPGAPSIYYGDEVGLTGGPDPFNRKTYPWPEDGGKPDNNLLKNVKKLTKLRNDNEVLRRGSLKNIYADKNVIVMEREYNGKVAIIATNNSDSEKIVSIKLSDIEAESLSQLYDALGISNYSIKSDTYLEINVPAYYGRVLIGNRS